MDRYQIAANAEIAEVTGRWLKLSKAQQENIFGAYLFGKQSLWIDLNGQGEVTASASCCFGTDSNVARWSLDEVAKAAQAGTKLRCDR
jgi:hypothetical protein